MSRRPTPRRSGEGAALVMTNILAPDAPERLAHRRSDDHEHVTATGAVRDVTSRASTRPGAGSPAGTSAGTDTGPRPPRRRGRRGRAARQDACTRPGTNN